MNPCRPHEHPLKGLTEEQRAAAHDLIGTCSMSNPEWLEDLMTNGSKEALEELDDIVFECADCGWWCAAEECNETGDSWVCDDCDEVRERD